MSRATRVGRIIAARYLWDSRKRYITLDFAHEAFRYWEARDALREWPRSELRQACDEAARQLLHVERTSQGTTLLKALTGR